MKTTEEYTKEPWLFTIEEIDHGFGLHYLILGAYLSTQTQEQLDWCMSSNRVEIMHAYYRRRDGKPGRVVTLDAIIRGAPCTLELPRKAPQKVQDYAWKDDERDPRHIEKTLLQLCVQEIKYLASEGPSRLIPKAWAVRGTRLWFDKGACTKEEYSDKAFAYNPLLDELQKFKMH